MKGTECSPEQRGRLMELAADYPKKNGKWNDIAAIMNGLTGGSGTGEQWRREYRYWMYEVDKPLCWQAPIKESPRPITAERLWNYLEGQGKYYPFSVAGLEKERGWTGIGGLLQDLLKCGIPLIDFGDGTWVYTKGKFSGGKWVNMVHYGERSCTIGIGADLHGGHMAQQPTHLRDYYARLKRAGAEAALHAGDMIEGIYPTRPEHEYEIFAHGLDAQISAVKAAMDGLDFIPTYIIDSNHPFTFMKHGGIKAGRLMGQRIPGIKYVGDIEGDVQLRPWLTIRMWHPDGGGSPDDPMKQARAYIKSLPDNEKPQVLIIGHYHKLGYECIEGVHCFLAGCFVGRTRFACGNRLRYEMGAWIANFSKGAGGKVEVNWILPVRYHEERHNDFDANITYQESTETKETPSL